MPPYPEQTLALPPPEINREESKEKASLPFGGEKKGEKGREGGEGEWSFSSSL